MSNFLAFYDKTDLMKYGINSDCSSNSGDSDHYLSVVTCVQTCDLRKIPIRSSVQ